MKFGWPYLGNTTTAAARAVLPISAIVLIKFRVSEQWYGSRSVKDGEPRTSTSTLTQLLSSGWYGCQCWGFLTFAEMLMHAISDGGCTDTVRESALKDD